METINRKYDTTAPKETRACCENYDDRYGCCFKERCTAPECNHFKQVVLKVAAIEGVLSKDKIKTLRLDVRLCPDCGKVPLKRRQRVCESCANKRRRSAYRQYRAKKSA